MTQSEWGWGGGAQSGCLTQPEDQGWLSGGEGIRDEDTGMSQGVSLVGRGSGM